MKKIQLSLIIGLLNFSVFAQKEKEVPLPSDLKKVTVFFLGAQVEHQANTQLKKGKQEVVFTKLTDFLDPNTVQVKANGDLTILSVRTRKNFEDIRISNDKMDALNAQRLVLEKKEIALRDEYEILELDKELLMRNRDLKGQDKGISMFELKEAYAFMHQKMNEITVRESAIYDELEKLTKEMNKLEQEILSQRSKPVINYTEIVVEIDVEKETDASFFFNYISPKASWKPYYDMRSDGIGKPIKLEAKALVSQNTGIEWKNVDMVLSTNDPYENSKEPIIAPWYINYNNYPQQKYQTQRNLPTVDYSGEKIQGEVIDANTGEPMPFTKISFLSNPSIGVITDVDGKFSVSVPRNERQIIASFVGYQSSTQSIDAPYLKFFMVANEVELEEVVVLQDKRSNGRQTVTREDISRLPVRSADGIASTLGKKKYKAKNKAYASAYDEVSKTEDRKAQYVQTQVVKKDLRMEYQIQSKMSIPTDGMDHRVQIANFDLDASYEYHTAPKIDPAVFLAAQVTGWEKLNLLSGESNIYFDGTYIGKSYIDVNSTKDTLSFSFGKDSKVIVERTKVKDKSSNKVLGSRQKYEVTWEIRMRNNGGASIPIIVKDQFPISTNNEIKVRNGEFGTAQLTEKTGILVWKLNLPLGGSQNLQFGYTVDYQKGYTLYLE
jgi:hypothetical protein